MSTKTTKKYLDNNYLPKEKISFKVSESLFFKLKEDAESFNFYKGDSLDVNFNHFYLTIINNYYSEYLEEKEKRKDAIEQIFDSHNISKEEILPEILKALEATDETNSPCNNNHSISIKPTKNTQALLNTIYKNTKTESFQGELRSILHSYSKKSRINREKIIFKNNIESIKDAIDANKGIYITTKSQFLFYPYAICVPKEEYYSYVIGYNSENKALQPLKIANIRSIEKDYYHPIFFFSEKQKELLEKTASSSSPQWMYQENQKEILVDFSPKGIEKYKKIILSRPEIKKIEETSNHHYLCTFDCPYEQLRNYLVRFEGEAKILDPIGYSNNFYKMIEKTLYKLSKKKNN